MRVARVLLPLPLGEAFDYVVPDGLEAMPGAHVSVPLGPRLAHGVVLEVADREGVNRPLKAIDSRMDAPPLPPGTLQFVEWARATAPTPRAARSPSR
jgi:primosomal protein N' (replication factor Y)